MIGILGGTFDPIHFGHLRFAQELGEALALTEVRLLPCRPGHRHAPQAGESQRLDMLRLAVADNPFLVADDRDLRRSGPTYSVDTLSELRAERGDVPLVLLMGHDAFCGLPSWKDWTRLFELAHIVVAERPGETAAFPPQLASILAQRRITQHKALAGEPAGRVLLAPLTALDISATRIRALLAVGRSPRYLLPEPVLDYIERHHLYRPASPGTP